MRSLFKFIITPVGARRYNNTRDIGGIEFIISTSEENHLASNRYAEVIDVPIGYTGEILPGDILLVHHNVFKFYNNMSGERTSSHNFMKDNTFLLDENQFFMYKRDGEWHPVDRYCFVKPVPVKKSTIFKPTKEEPLVGIMRYPNKYLLGKGITDGTEVLFRPDSEYEFDVDGEKLYRMYDNHIVGVA